MRPGLKVNPVQDAKVVLVHRDPSSPSPRLCSRSSPSTGSANAQLSVAARGRDGAEPDLAGFRELLRPARASCADRKRGENWRFIALSLFPSSERSHQKIQPDKAHRPALDDFTAVSKAERAPERSLVQPPAYDKKRLRDCSSERSEGRLPRPGLSGGAWALLHTQPLSPPSASEKGGTHCFWALSPPQRCLVCSNCFIPQGLASWQLRSEDASLSCSAPQHRPFLVQTVLLSAPSPPAFCG